MRIVFFLDEFVDDVGVHAGEAHLLELLLQHVDEVRVEEAGHQQNVVAFLLRIGDIDVLVVGVGSVQHDNISVFVSLQRAHHIAVLLNSEVFALGVFQQVEVLDFVVELLVGQRAVFEEDAQVVPFLLELLAVLLEHLLQLLGHLLADVGGDFLDVVVALEVGAGDVQRDVGRVDDAVQQVHEVGHDAFQLIGDKDLVAIELHAVLLEVELVLDFREVEHAGEVEGVIDVQVDVEHRLLERHRVEFVVELVIVLVG